MWQSSSLPWALGLLRDRRIQRCMSFLLFRIMMSRTLQRSCEDLVFDRIYSLAGLYSVFLRLG